jgi:hypothetical protein
MAINAWVDAFVKIPIQKVEHIKPLATILEITEDEEGFTAECRIPDKEFFDK